MTPGKDRALDIGREQREPGKAAGILAGGRCDQGWAMGIASYHGMRAAQPRNHRQVAPDSGWRACRDRGSGPDAGKRDRQDEVPGSRRIGIARKLFAAIERAGEGPAWSLEVEEKLLALIALARSPLRDSRPYCSRR
jgi:hypothetical protein